MANKTQQNKSIKQSSLAKFETKKAKTEIKKLNHLEEVLSHATKSATGHIVKQAGQHVGKFVNDLLGGSNLLGKGRLRSGLASSSGQIGISEHSAAVRDEVHSIKGSMGTDRMIVSGCCMLDVFQTDTRFPSSVGGSGNAFIMKSWFVHPGTLPSPRLHALLALYSKYKFKKFRLEYRPQVPTTTVGAIIAAIKQDLAPVNALPGVDVRVELAETESFTEFRVWESAEMSLMHKDGQLSHYSLDRSSEDLYTVFQAQVIFGGIGLLAGNYYGDIYCHYELELDGPRVPETHWDYTRSQKLFSSGGAITQGNPISWNCRGIPLTEDSLSPGIFLCSLAQENWGALANARMDNFYGAYFYIRIDERIDYAQTPSIRFFDYGLYKSFAGACSGRAVSNMENAVLVIEAAYVNASLLATFDGMSVPQQISNPVSYHSGRLGLSFGPGILAGMPDIIPSIDFTSGRFVCAPPVDLSYEDEKRPENKPVVNQFATSFRRN